MARPSAWPATTSGARLPAHHAPEHWQRPRDPSPGASPVAAFAELARQHSTDESAKKGGDIGRIHKGQLPGEAEKVVSQLSPGQVSAPVRVLEGYAIFHLRARHDAELQPFEKVRERVEALYERATSRRQLEAFLEDLRGRTRVETFDISAHVEEFMKNR